MPKWTRHLAATQILPSSSLGASSTLKQNFLFKIKIMIKFKHITLNALKSTCDLEKLITVKNQSKTMDITMPKDEIKDLENRFFIDIEPEVPDRLFGKILEHFKDEGTLFDKTDLTRI